MRERMVTQSFYRFVHPKIQCHDKIYIFIFVNIVHKTRYIVKDEKENPKKYKIQDPLKMMLKQNIRQEKSFILNKKNLKKSQRKKKRKRFEESKKKKKQKKTH